MKILNKNKADCEKAIQEILAKMKHQDEIHKSYRIYTLETLKEKHKKYNDLHNELDDLLISFGKFSLSEKCYYKKSY
ncbi:MAG TPA: hypothetical protein ENH96_02595 [Chlamydiae bacterium]|nr:hypothetical protein [Chlamydiota bacterium]